MRCIAVALLLLPWGCSDDVLPPDDAGTDAAPPDASIDAPAPETGPDLGPDAPPPDSQSCAAPAPVDTRKLFTALEADLATLTDPAKRAARIDTFMKDVAVAGGTPLRDATHVVFLYRGLPTGTLSVAGTFNGWTPGADPMQTFGGTDLCYLDKPVAPAGQEYKLVTAAGTWLQDPLNRNVTWDGIPSAGLGAFNSVVPPWSATGAKGRLEWLQVASPELGNTRDVFVYLPAAYDQESCARYGALLVNDGNESITRSHFDQVADATIAAGKARPVILVFVALASQADRMSEYSCDAADKGDEYADFLCDTLLPLVDKTYRTEGTPQSRGVIGASMGGLSAYAALWWRNDCLRRAGAQSGSFFYKSDMMIDRVKGSTSVQVSHAYLDNGLDNLDCTHDMRDALKAQSIPVYHWENTTQDHEWSAWQDRFDEALAHLFP